jgi:hypothetical protein
MRGPAASSLAFRFFVPASHDPKNWAGVRTSSCSRLSTPAKFVRKRLLKFPVCDSKYFCTHLGRPYESGDFFFSIRWRSSSSA